MFIPKIEVPDEEQQKIVELYKKGKSPFEISKLFTFSKKVVIRILRDNGIDSRQTAKFKITTENRDKLITYFINDSNAHSKYKITKEYLDKFDDLYKYSALRSLLLKHCPKEIATQEFLEQFIDKFYFDTQFTEIYENYNNKYFGKSWAKPSLDHIIPLSRGGRWTLDNLQILTWAENRAKYKYTQEEWNYIKNKYFKGRKF